MPDFTADSYIAAQVVPSPNVDERKTGAPDMILLHYTGMQDGQSALERLCAPESANALSAVPITKVFNIGPNPVLPERSASSADHNPGVAICVP